MARVERPSPTPSLRTVVRAVLTLLTVAALMPAVAGAQEPGVGGYAPTGPATVTPTPQSDVLDTGTEGSSDPDTAQPVTPPSTTTLPFTGLQIAFMLAAGLGLLGLGMALRRISGPALSGT